MLDAMRKDVLLNAAVRSYAKYGKDGLKTKCLAKEAGCSEALIYRHFKSVDELLAACYMRLHARAQALSDGMAMPEGMTKEEALKKSMDHWMNLFKFFIEAGDESLFYFDFRMSPEFKKILQGQEEINETYLGSFMNVFEGLRVKFGLTTTDEEFRTFLVSITGVFVIKIVTGELPKTEECYRSICGLVFGGITSAVPGMSMLPKIE